MAKAIFSDRNYIPDSTLSGGSYETLLPLDNAKERPFSKVARTTDATTASTYFEIDLLEAINTRLLSLVNHNITSASATIRFRASNDPGATTNLLYDSGALKVLPSVYDWITNDFFNDNWFYGEPFAEDLNLFTRQFIHVTDVNIRARYWRVDIDDDTNADGYIQFGYFYASEVYEPTTDIQLSSSLSFIDNTGIQEAISGVEYFDNREKPRVLIVGLRAVDKNEMLSNLFITARRQGRGGLIYIIPDKDDALNINKESFLGRLTELPAFRDYTFGIYETQIALKEVI